MCLYSVNILNHPQKPMPASDGPQVSDDEFERLLKICLKCVLVLVSIDKALIKYQQLGKLLIQF